MRQLTRPLLALALASAAALSPWHCQPASAQTRAANGGGGSGDRVVISKRRIVILRTGEIARQFPARRRAVVNLPVVRSHPDPAVLRKVRALFDMKYLFDTTLAEHRQDAWLEEMDFKVNYNQNFILDVTAWQSGTGAYPDIHTKHLAVDLRRGELIRAADVFKPESLPALARMADEKLQAEIKETLSDFDRRTDVAAGERESAAELLAPLKFEVKDLDEMMITGRGVAFLYDAAFPHVVRALQPAGEYLFTYQQLAPHVRRDGLLAQFVR